MRFVVLRCRDELEPEFSGLAVEMSELSVEAPLLVGVDALLDVFLAFGHHEVDQAGEFAGGRLDRNGGVHSGEPCAVLGADEGLAAARGHGRHAQGLPDGVDRLRGLAGEVLAAADPGSRRERKPGAEVLGGGEGGEVRADLRGDHQCGTGTDGGDRGEVDAHHSAQRQGLDALLAGVVACGVRRAARRGFGGRAGGMVRCAAVREIVRRCQALDLGHHPGLAVVDLLGQEVVALHGLFEGEQMLLAPRPLKARGDRIGVGLDAPVAERRQALWVTLAVDDRAQDALAGQSRDVGDHRVELDVHLGQRLLHVQDAAGAVPGQPPHLARA